MAPGSLLTRPGQVQYGELLLGAGTPYRWRTLTGWEDLPGLDSGTVPRSDTHGAFPGLLLAQARTITLEGLVVRAPRDRIGAVVGALGAALVPVEDERPLAVWLDERGPLLVHARATRRAIPATAGYRLGTITGGAIEFVATDPRRYAPVEQVTTAGLPAAEPGLNWQANTAAQLLPPGQAAGAASAIDTFWVVEGLTLGTAAGLVTATITAASASIAWASAPGAYTGFPIEPGQTVTFLADAAPLGTILYLHWLDNAGQYLSATTGTRGRVSGTAPAGAAQARPIMRWPTIPSPATVTIGPSRLLMPALAGTGLAWPLMFGTPGSSGSLTTVNSGDAATHPVIEFRGPVVRPSLTNTDTGDVLEYDLPLTADDVLAVDAHAGTVTLNSTASRLFTATTRSVPEQTFTLPPGTTNLAFRAAPGSTDPNASVTVRYRSAYW
ncbi:phage tail family protein [Streptomyces sp. TRM66268-LWL]|uniref:Phage tail family protein n=1 Tax=Streptomyces polyasparticus TaxID=2767826 RepID=A0ABR7SF04_9ACTN|nr:phage tail family protein [Streptomyces polyasparticus]MBC9714081.1 phage tail family protein [Streptomyces polyasparticus]